MKHLPDLLDTLHAADAVMTSQFMPHAAAAEPPAQAQTLPVDALHQQLRDAQVALFCDHDEAALHALREARQELVGHVPNDSPLLVAVEEAVWFVRRHDMVGAHRAIAFLDAQLH